MTLKLDESWWQYTSWWHWWQFMIVDDSFQQLTTVHSILWKVWESLFSWKRFKKQKLEKLFQALLAFSIQVIRCCLMVNILVTNLLSLTPLSNKRNALDATKNTYESIHILGGIQNVKKILHSTQFCTVPFKLPDIFYHLISQWPYYSIGWPNVF